MRRIGKVEGRLESLCRMPAAELRQEWQDQFSEAAPAVSSNLLRLALGHALQEQAFGKLGAVQAKYLQGGVPAPEPTIQLKPGTRLVREWNGRMYTVLVREGGFEFDGKLYSTLSAIAERITGAHWSGPRFFGLKRRSAPPIKRAVANG